MGAPSECERVVDASGDTEQKTTTGLAYYRAKVNTPVFTNGVEHWALTSDGLVHWTSDELEPPAGAESSGAATVIRPPGPCRKARLGRG